MRKLMNNWIFTLVVCILTALLALLMLLDGLGVGDLFISKKVLHLLASVALGLYTVFVIFPLTVRYRGKIQAFVIGEALILVLLVVGLFCCNFSNNIPLLSSLEICSVMGFALWLRGAVETVRAYLLRGTALKNQTPLWALCLYILLSFVGVWQMFAPSVRDIYFIFCLATLAFVIAAIFGYATVMNRFGVRMKIKSKPTDPQTLPVPSEPATDGGEQPEAEAPAEAPETKK